MVTDPKEQDGGRPLSLIWERMDRPARGPAPALSHHQIARAGIELADAGGLDAVSMRHLAGRLGVAAMALYRYVDSKDDVFDLMMDAAHGEVPVPPHGGSWRSDLTGLALRYRDLWLSHPWLPQLAAIRPPLTPQILTQQEFGLGALDGLGLDVDTMMAALQTVLTFVQGAVAAEIASREGRKRHAWTSGDQERAALAPYVRRILAEGRYPNVSRFIIEGTDDDDDDADFAFGLDCVLDGIAARLNI